MLNEELLKNTMLHLNNKISDEDLGIVMKELQILLNDYDVSRRATDLMVYEDLPKAYKVFMVTKKLEGRSSGTLELYQLCLEHFFDSIGKSLDEITTNDIRVYLYYVKDTRGISDRTLDNRRLILNNFFTWCSQEGYISSNPCATIAPIKFECKPREPLSDIEMERLRMSCVTSRERAILEVLYGTGCRCYVI